MPNLAAIEPPTQSPARANPAAVSANDEIELGEHTLMSSPLQLRLPNLLMPKGKLGAPRREASTTDLPASTPNKETANVERPSRYTALKERVRAFLEAAGTTYPDLGGTMPAPDSAYFTPRSTATADVSPASMPSLGLWNQDPFLPRDLFETTRATVDPTAFQLQQDLEAYAFQVVQNPLGGEDHSDGGGTDNEAGAAAAQGPRPGLRPYQHPPMYPGDDTSPDSSFSSGSSDSDSDDDDDHSDRHNSSSSDSCRENEDPVPEVLESYMAAANNDSMLWERKLCNSALTIVSTRPAPESGAPDAAKAYLQVFLDNCGERLVTMIDPTLTSPVICLDKEWSAGTLILDDRVDVIKGITDYLRVYALLSKEEMPMDTDGALETVLHCIVQDIRALCVARDVDIGDPRAPAELRFPLSRMENRVGRLLFPVPPSAPAADAAPEGLAQHQQQAAPGLSGISVGSTAVGHKWVYTATEDSDDDDDAYYGYQPQRNQPHHNADTTHPSDYDSADELNEPYRSEYRMRKGVLHTANQPLWIDFSVKWTIDNVKDVEEFFRWLSYSFSQNAGRIADTAWVIYTPADPVRYICDTLKDKTDSEAVKLKITTIEPKLRTYYDGLVKPPEASIRDILIKLTEECKKLCLEGLTSCEADYIRKFDSYSSSIAGKEANYGIADVFATVENLLKHCNGKRDSWMAARILVKYLNAYSPDMQTDTGTKRLQLGQYCLEQMGIRHTFDTSQEPVDLAKMQGFAINEYAARKRMLLPDMVTRKPIAWYIKPPASSAPQGSHFNHQAAVNGRQRSNAPPRTRGGGRTGVYAGVPAPTATATAQPQGRQGQVQGPRQAGAPPTSHAPTPPQQAIVRYRPSRDQFCEVCQISGHDKTNCWASDPTLPGNGDLVRAATYGGHEDHRRAIWLESCIKMGFPNLTAMEHAAATNRRFQVAPAFRDLARSLDKNSQRWYITGLRPPPQQHGSSGQPSRGGYGGGHNQRNGPNRYGSQDQRSQEPLHQAPQYGPTRPYHGVRAALLSQVGVRAALPQQQTPNQERLLQQVLQTVSRVANSLERGNQRQAPPQDQDPFFRGQQQYDDYPYVNSIILLDPTMGEGECSVNAQLMLKSFEPQPTITLDKEGAQYKPTVPAATAPAATTSKEAKEAMAQQANLTKAMAELETMHIQLASWKDRLDNSLAPVLAARARLEEHLPALTSLQNDLPQHQQRVNDLKRLFQAVKDSGQDVVAATIRLRETQQDLLPRYANKKYTVGFLSSTDPLKGLAIRVDGLLYSLIKALVDTGSHINTISPREVKRLGLKPVQRQNIVVAFDNSRVSLNLLCQDVTVVLEAGSDEPVEATLDFWVMPTESPFNYIIGVAAVAHPNLSMKVDLVGEVIECYPNRMQGGPERIIYLQMDCSVPVNMPGIRVASDAAPDLSLDMIGPHFLCMTGIPEGSLPRSPLQPLARQAQGQQQRAVQDLPQTPPPVDAQGVSGQENVTPSSPPAARPEGNAPGRQSSASQPTAHPMGNAGERAAMRLRSPQPARELGVRVPAPLQAALRMIQAAWVTLDDAGQFLLDYYTAQSVPPPLPRPDLPPAPPCLPPTAEAAAVLQIMAYEHPHMRLRRTANMQDADGIGVLPKPRRMGNDYEPPHLPLDAWVSTISVAIRHDEFRDTPDGLAALQAVGFVALTAFGADVIAEGACGCYHGLHIRWDRPASGNFQEALLAYLVEEEDISSLQLDAETGWL